MYRSTLFSLLNTLETNDLLKLELPALLGKGEIRFNQNIFFYHLITPRDIKIKIKHINALLFSFYLIMPEELKPKAPLKLSKEAFIQSLFWKPQILFFTPYLEGYSCVKMYKTIFEKDAILFVQWYYDDNLTIQVFFISENSRQIEYPSAFKHLLDIEQLRHVLINYFTFKAMQKILKNEKLYKSLVQWIEKINQESIDLNETEIVVPVKYSIDDFANKQKDGKDRQLHKFYNLPKEITITAPEIYLEWIIRNEFYKELKNISLSDKSISEILLDLRFTQSKILRQITAKVRTYVPKGKIQCVYCKKFIDFKTKRKKFCSNICRKKYYIAKHIAEKLKTYNISFEYKNHKLVLKGLKKT